MKVIDTRQSANLELMKVYCLADLHIGSPKCNLKKVLEVRDRIKDDPQAYCVILGDLINNTTKASVGDVYDQPLSPMQQIQTVVEIFRPIKDKILAVTSGNHEARTYKQDGIDLIHFFCMELGIEDRYDFNSCCLVVRFGHNCRVSGTKNKNTTMSYTFYMCHGSGGGRTAGSKANAIDRASQIVTNADITIIGHQHSPMAYMDADYFIETRGGSAQVVLQEHLKVMCSSFLNWESYAEKNNMKPQPIAVPVIHLEGKPACGKKKFCCVIESV